MSNLDVNIQDDNLSIKISCGNNGLDGTGYKLTSSSSILIPDSVGNYQTFSINIPEQGFAYSVGARIRFWSNSDSTKIIEGIITSIVNNDITIYVDFRQGSDIYSDWICNICGNRPPYVLSISFETNDVVFRRVDITNPSAPVFAEEVYREPGHLWNFGAFGTEPKAVMDKDYLYINVENKLRIYKRNSYSSMSFVASASYPVGMVNDCIKYNNRVFGAVFNLGDPVYRGYISMDISNPSNPTLGSAIGEGQAGTQYGIASVAIDNTGSLYTGFFDGGYGLRKKDISTEPITGPMSLVNFDTATNIGPIAVKDNYVYWSHDSKIVVIRLSDNTKVAQFNYPFAYTGHGTGNAAFLKIKQNYLYLSGVDSNGKIAICDISNPEAPFTASVTPTTAFLDAYTYHAVVIGNTLVSIASDGSTVWNLYCTDISDKTNPIQKGIVQCPDNGAIIGLVSPDDEAVQGNNFYINT